MIRPSPLLAAALLIGPPAAGADAVPSDRPPDSVGANHRSWIVHPEDVLERGRPWPDPDVPFDGPRVVELATGMNYWDGEQYVPSEPSFELVEDGFLAERVQHQTFSPWSFPQTADDCIPNSSPGLLLRIEFEDDGNCMEFNDNNQIATAQAVISVGCPTTLTIYWCGEGEHHQTNDGPLFFEQMSLFVNGDHIAEAHADGDDQECAPMVPVISADGFNDPPHVINLQEGIHLLRIHTTTGDHRFHFGAFYEFKFILEPQQ